MEGVVVEEDRGHPGSATSYMTASETQDPDEQMSVVTSDSVLNERRRQRDRRNITRTQSEEEDPTSLRK